MLNVFIGPPGTGKTTTLHREARKMVEYGVVFGDVVFLSFNRSVADENEERGRQIGVRGYTFHGIAMSLAHTFLGLRPISPEYAWRVWASTWRRVVGGRCSMDPWRRTRCNVGRELFTRALHAWWGSWMDGVRVESAGDERLGDDVLSVADAYLAELESRGFTDPTMYIVYVVEEGLEPADPPGLLALDEAQDYSTLLWGLAAALGAPVTACSSSGTCVRGGDVPTLVAGDPAQAIYTGLIASRPDILDSLARKAPSRVLKRSKRVPRAVWRLATEIDRRFLGYDWPWEPRQAEGLVAEIAQRQVPELALQLAKRCRGRDPCVAVLTRKNEAALSIMRELAQRGAVPHTLKQPHPMKTEPNAPIVVDTAFTAKGLEWDYVIYVPDEYDGRDKAYVDYVAATRAKEELYVATSGQDIDHDAPIIRVLLKNK